jgi:glutaredoxin
MEGVVVEVYWRPGCLFCSSLRAGLQRSGVAVREVNIWEDPEAAARVRSVTGGSETVPTVFVGDRVLVNPSLEQVLALVGDDSSGAMRSWWPPVLGSVAFALLWLVLAASSKATTYHLAPLLVAGAPPVVGRWWARARIGPPEALRLAVNGLVVAGLAIAVLAWLGMLDGPDLVGGNHALIEAVVASMTGAAAGLWLAQRRSRHAQDSP